MAEEEWKTEEATIKEVRREMKKVRNLRRTSESGDTSRQATSIRFRKDPDPALTPGILSYESTPRELEKWISGFKAYLANGSRQEPETVIAYIERAMDEDYRSNGVPAKLDKKTSNEEMFNVLSEDMEIRYPVTLRRLKLFQVKREKDENILSFINRVREDARYSDIDG